MHTRTNPVERVQPAMSRDRRAAAGLFLCVFVLYNANGREIGSYDTLPTKLAARELLLRGSLTLNHVVGATPEYRDRWGFVLTPDGNYRAVFSPVPAVLAAMVTWPAWQLGVIDIRAPRAPALMAAFTASLLVSISVVLAFLTARRWLAVAPALLVAAGLGLGTGYWSTASQTLWQTESALPGLAAAVFALTRPEPIRLREALLIGGGLALAGAARPQLAPMIVVLVAGTWFRAGRPAAALATSIVVVVGAALCGLNLRWFGHALGPQALLQDVNAQLHATVGAFSLHLEGLAGLLVSPNRGLLVYSPVVIVAILAMRRSIAQGRHSPVYWCTLAAVTQFLVYGFYSVWWAGHTYGPRYLLDVLPVGVPLAALTLAAGGWGLLGRSLGSAALAWSIVVAATGAFCYPHERWNVDPYDVDRQHARLWWVSDNQIRRCWIRGPSPQNFSLFDPRAIRQSSERP